jgi:hypothetical protein
MNDWLRVALGEVAAFFGGSVLQGLSKNTIQFHLHIIA